MFSFVLYIDWEVGMHSLIKFYLQTDRNDSPDGMDEMPLMIGNEGFETDENEYLMRPRGTHGLQKKGLCYYLCDGWKDACSRLAH